MCGYQRLKQRGSRHADELKGYLAQMRMEVGSRLAKRIIDPKTKRVSKVSAVHLGEGLNTWQWWVCFRKRKFMGESFEVIQ